MRNPVGLRFMMFMFMMFMSCLVTQVVYGEEEVKCIEREREALLRFKASIVDRYGMLSSWTTPHCCQWQGIRCSNLTGHILMLDLHGEVHEEISFNFYLEFMSQRFVSGMIHKSLMKLRQLQYLNLSSNSFGDNNIPEFLGSLTKLRYLDLSSCGFNGKILTQFGSLSHLKYLSLADNNLEGSIPRQLGNLFQLQHLDLSRNHLKGKIPIQLGNLTRLQYLDLRANDLEGNIPSQLGNLSNLHELYIGHGGALKIGDGDLSENTLMSTMIFQWVSNFTPNLVELDLSGNLMEGSVPNHFGVVMNSLEHLNLYYNRFKVEVLQSLMNICTLKSLNMGGNNLNQGLSSILRNLSSSCARYSLQELDLAFCQIYGSFPDFSTFTTLKTLDLSSNQLSGKIPEGILPSRLESLSLLFNSLEGEIPKSVGNTCTLHSLDMSYNRLSGEFASIFQHLSGCAKNVLQDLKLGSNNINGTFPDLSSFSTLKILDLSENQLSGEIPEGNPLPCQLESLSIQSNTLEGGVPKSFGNACALRLLHMFNNSLSEEFPVIVHHLSGCTRNSLEILSLGMNQINVIIILGFESKSIVRKDSYINGIPP
ncbi:LRR receptor-like serine/threonine-protein kinase FLS2 [Vigna unguiculata]|uniref:LRR receptor-like serine/threonine-protein kinase FLS2 n=1 Tax=Vigna unguiculata TaxID=3917 RepID=A0A4D6M1P2_VIGUN|nr:LRR receptor-like serine/threonine-protein kinase FLS2 [Vigna unguiculata]